jgi:hypothetical protein
MNRRATVGHSGAEVLDRLLEYVGLAPLSFHTGTTRALIDVYNRTGAMILHALYTYYLIQLVITTIRRFQAEFGIGALSY